MHIVDGVVQTNDKFPYYKLAGSNTFMWWMWHGKVGHWVVNGSPGKHGDDRVKSKFGQFVCPDKKGLTWEGLASIHNFQVIFIKNHVNIKHVLTDTHENNHINDVKHVLTNIHEKNQPMQNM